MDNDTVLKTIKAQIPQVDLGPFLKDLGADKLDDAARAQIEAKIISLIEKRIILRLSDVVTDEDAEKMEKMNEEEVIAYLDKKGINLFDIGTEEGMSLREEMIENMGYVNGLIDAKKNEGKE